MISAVGAVAVLTLSFYLATVLATAASTWDPELRTLHLFWSTSDPEAAANGFLALTLCALFSHNVSLSSASSAASATLRCARQAVRLDLIEVNGPVVTFRTQESLKAGVCSSPPSSCHIFIDVYEWALVSSWTGSPVREHLEVAAPSPCDSVSAPPGSSEIGVKGTDVLCEMACGSAASLTHLRRSTALVVDVGSADGVDLSAEVDASDAFTELESGADQIPGLSEILKIVSSTFREGLTSEVRAHCMALYQWLLYDLTHSSSRR